MGLLWLHRHQCDCAHYQSFAPRRHWPIPFRSYRNRTLILGSQHGWNQQGLATSEMTTNVTPGQERERTADRHENLLLMTSQLKPEARLALVSGRSASSR